MEKEIVEKFKSHFTTLNLNDQSLLDDIYASNIKFKDPIHEISGIESLKKYFSKLNKNLLEGTFLFTEETILENKAYLSWEMNLRLKKPKKNVSATGISVLSFDKKINGQRDYFDAGELFYENVPILGGIVRLLKKNLTN